MDARAVTGRIFDIQRFSLHDGPGIRTIVFLKGCRLRCAWCCNPESQRYEIEPLCQQGQTRMIGRDVRVSEVLDEVLQDQPYYQRSGGGVTLSGGEALCQIDFAHALLSACQEEGLHTAIETTACAPFEDIARVLPLLDTVLLDIKHMDFGKHERFTGRDNALILDNARRLAPLAKHLIVRIPVVPGFNDTPEEIGAIATFAAGLRGVRGIHLLPYHRLGQDKYIGLNRPYPMGDVPPPSQTHMDALCAIAARSGLDCQVGG